MLFMKMNNLPIGSIQEKKKTQKQKQTTQIYIDQLHKAISQMKNYCFTIVEYIFFLLQKVISYLLNNKMTYTYHSIYYSQVSI